MMDSDMGKAGFCLCDEETRSGDVVLFYDLRGGVFHSLWRVESSYFIPFDPNVPCHYRAVVKDGVKVPALAVEEFTGGPLDIDTLNCKRLSDEAYILLLGRFAGEGVDVSSFPVSIFQVADLIGGSNGTS